MSDRITYNGDREPHHLDEIVLTGARVHIERMNQHDWAVILNTDAGLIYLTGRDLAVFEHGLEHLVTVGPPLLGCCHEWQTRDHVWHRCEHDTDHTNPHFCDCGKRLP